MDQFKIHCEQLGLLDVVEDIFVLNDPSRPSHFKLKTTSSIGRLALPVTAVRREYPKGRSVTISLGAASEIQVQASIRNRDWLVSSIKGNLPKLLYGHNGVVIRSETDFLIGLTRLKQLIEPFVPETQRRFILPGLGEGNQSSWGMVSLPVHVDDPGGYLLGEFRHARHTGMRDAPRRVDGESMKLVGEKKSLSIYRKDIESRGQYKRAVREEDRPVLRFEFEWHDEDLVRRAQKHRGSLCSFTRAGDLSSFQWPFLYQLFRETMAEVRGTFRIPPRDSAKKFRGVARVWAELARVHGVPIGTSYDLDQRLTSRSQKTRNDIRLAAEAIMEGTSELALETIFPAAFPRGPNIRLPVIEQTVDELGLARYPDPAIVKAYGDPLISKAGSFHPHLLFK